MARLRFLLLIPVVAVLALAARVNAEPILLDSPPTLQLITTLSPNAYTVRAGDQMTLFGFFTSFDMSTFTYYQEFLFGLQPTSPHLLAVAGSVVSSTDFDPTTGPAYFQDVFAGAGYLGPAIVQAPGSTPVTPLRTFTVPSDTAPGLYHYSYGVYFLPPPNSGPGYQLFDQSLTINVTPTPEPTALLLLGSGLVVAAIRGRRAMRGRRHTM